MANVIKLGKGLNINIAGAPEEKWLNVPEAKTVTLVPDDFVLCTPKVVVKAGEPVKAGQVVYTDKQYPEIKMVSPVSGTLREVVRGDRRKVLGIVIDSDGKGTSVELAKVDVEKASADEIKQAMLEGGVWPFMTERPYGVLANPAIQPRDIFVNCIQTAPLSPRLKMITEGQEEAFNNGLKALKKLTSGKVYCSFKEGCKFMPKVTVAGVEKVEFERIHPAGNVGVQINHIKPINKGEKVWTIDAQGVITIGKVLAGKADYTKVISVAGSELVQTGYAKVQCGQAIAEILDGKVKHTDAAQRIINGNVLTGVKSSMNGSLGFKADTICVIPEGNKTDEMLGWFTPGLKRYSTQNTSLSGLLGTYKKVQNWVMDARLLGGPRALIVSGEWEKVFPMDIYPEHLYKAVLAFDIDKMEQLGIYEVLPEDFALCEFVCPSKTPIQQVIADGLVKLRKEME